MPSHALNVCVLILVMIFKTLTVEGNMLPRAISRLMQEFPKREWIIFSDLPTAKDEAIQSLINAQANFKFQVICQANRIKRL